MSDQHKTTASPVEIVARAICEDGSGPFDLLSPAGQVATRREAVAALRAVERWLSACGEDGAAACIREFVYDDA